MKQVYIQNLALLITDRCNLNCDHCMRGKKYDNNMSEQIIKTSLEQICKIDTLLLGGGEPSVAFLPLYHLLKYIENNKIDIDQIVTIINGTIYSPDFLELLDEINSHNIDIKFFISSDKYHDNELKRLELQKEYIDNLIKYRKNKFYVGVKMLNKHTKLFREGNALNLDKNLTMDIMPSKIYLTYTDENGLFDKNGLCNIGPMVTINPDGIITEYESSFENQKTKYNYGNILENSIEEICLKRGKVLKPSKYKQYCEKEIKRYIV